MALLTQVILRSIGAFCIFITLAKSSTRELCHTYIASPEAMSSDIVANMPSIVATDYGLYRIFSTPLFNPRPFNPRLFNHEFVNSMVEKFMTEKSSVKIFMVEKSGVERFEGKAWQGRRRRGARARAR